MRRHILAIGIALTLGSLAAAGAFASNDRVRQLVVDPTATETPVDTQTPEATATPTDTVEPTATPTGETATATPTATGVPGATGTPEATETPSDTPEATETPEATGTPEGDGDVGGIPEDNPSHHDDNGDGVCDKHETVIKTTPSGKKVRVPCHADHGGH